MDIKEINKFLNIIIDICIVINILLMILSVTLYDWNLFKIASISGCLLVFSRLYREQEEEE